MDPFIGEVRLFSFNDIPQGWAACEGQLIAIQTNQALFSLLGTTYGGNGVNTFALPDLRGRVPLHVGPSFPAGAKGGEETHTLLVSELPSHTHQASGSSQNPSPDIGGAVWGAQDNSYGPPQSMVTMSPAAIGTAGAGQAHNNMQPYLAVTFCIATAGIYPSRN